MFCGRYKEAAWPAQGDYNPVKVNRENRQKLKIGKGECDGHPWSLWARM